MTDFEDPRRGAKRPGEESSPPGDDTPGNISPNGDADADSDDVLRTGDASAGDHASTTGDDTILDPHATTNMPKRIGHYTITRLIASGGMGAVYEGVQDEPRRTVAIKVMKAGVVGPEALRRFHIESQHLARLRHPGIAQIYEAGTHRDGDIETPYFAMEYIPNAKSITEYADDKHLNMRERLELFSRVCDAVHHGHQRGITHRDLKPGNILVDSSGNPRVIDFGVARSGDSANSTIQTQVGQLIGSVQYMSPEQFDADPNDIDTRSDVYALGVVLYELMCHALPYDVGGRTIYEAARTVKESAPRRPGELESSLRGDVETVITKAIEKDRERRYQSAYGLAQDIRRHLSGDAIVARPASVGYQMRVFARKNRFVLATVIAAVVLLAVAAVVSTTMYVKAEKARQVAEVERRNALAAKEFLSQVLLTQLGDDEFGRDITMRRILDRAAVKIPTAFPDDPSTEADVRSTLGWGYFAALQWDRAETQLVEALALYKQTYGIAHPKTIEILNTLHVFYDISGNPRELERISRDLLQATIAQNGDAHETTAAMRYEMARFLGENDRLGEAGQQCTAALEVRESLFGETHENTLRSRVQTAWLRMLEGDLAQAEERGREALRNCEEHLGSGHNTTRYARSQLASVLIREGKVDDAAALYNISMIEDLGIVSSFQGAIEVPSEGNKLLVFWEQWCPFSQRTVPQLEEYHTRYGRNLEVIGFTQVSRTATDDKVAGFIRDKGITYPMLKENGSARGHFNIRGTPWIVLVRDGKLVWENYLETPERMPDEIVDSFVRSSDPRRSP